MQDSSDFFQELQSPMETTPQNDAHANYMISPQYSEDQQLG